MEGEVRWLGVSRIVRIVRRRATCSTAGAWASVRDAERISTMMGKTAVVFSHARRVRRLPKFRVQISMVVEAKSDDENDIIPLVQDLFALGFGDYAIHDWEEVK